MVDRKSALTKEFFHVAVGQREAQVPANRQQDDLRFELPPLEKTRNRRREEGFFEVIAGKSVVDFRRSDEEATSCSKCFSFVQTFDQKPRRRLWELLKSQGMQENQQVVFVSDGGDSVRNLQAYLHPDSEHWLDWFHITMRITVLQQQVKTLKCEQPEVGEEVARELESTKHFLWHGNTFQALQRLEGLLIDLEFPKIPSPLTQKVLKV